MTIRSQLAWYWRWLLTLLMMAAVGGIVWWLVQNSYRITGFDFEEAKRQMATLTEDNRTLKKDLETAKSSLTERERQLQIEHASQTELARTVAQLQEENSALKEDLGFLRNIMSSGATPEGIGVSNLKIEADARPQEYRYRMLLTQGGQRKQDFKGRLQMVARIEQKTGPAGQTTMNALDPEANLEFRFYQKVEGRFRVPDGVVVKSVEVRVMQYPGGQVKLSRIVNLP